MRPPAGLPTNHGLPEDWLNDAVKGFLHGEDPDAVPVLDTPGLRVDVASPRYLLAMKLLAALSSRSPCRSTR
jgi:hypothetical protein